MDVDEFLGYARGWITMQFIFLTDLCVWMSNWCRLSVYKKLDLSGVVKDEKLGVTFVYYTYDGNRYMIPMRKKRGPAKRYPELEEFLKDRPVTMLELMGPNNDWHGYGDELMEMFGITKVEKSEKESLNIAVGYSNITDDKPASEDDRIKMREAANEFERVMKRTLRPSF